MTEKNLNFVISNRANLIALFGEWQEEVLQNALGRDKGDEREFLIDFVRFLRERIKQIENIDLDKKIKKETFV